MIRIKICGMRDPDNIRAVAGLMPDYMGFIFYSGSRRNAGDLSAAALPSSAAISRIGVFVNEDAKEVRKKVKQYGLDGVQLHGDEGPPYCANLAGDGIIVIKAFGVDDRFDFDRVAAYRDACRYVLFDNRSEGRGGSGRKFDWSLLRRYDQSVPFFLSGGLDAGDAAAIGALRGMNLHAIDLNSGFEAIPGVKDAVRLAAFISSFRESQGAAAQQERRTPATE